MRIDLNPGVAEAGDGGPLAKSPSSGSSASPGSQSGADVAQLSTDYARVQALAAAVSQVPEVRQDKVAALAEMVHSGIYAVTPEQTADAMLSEMAGRAAA